MLNGATAAWGAPDGCVEEPPGSGIFVCRGNQSQGIGIDSDAVLELRVEALSPNEIIPDDGIEGIRFNSTSGGNVVLKSGDTGSPVGIKTRNASGIFLQSTGTATAPPTHTVLGIPIAGRDSVSGGVVQLGSHGGITTFGDAAHGIEAASSTTGYPQAVTDALLAFSESNVTFAVQTVDGSAGNLNQAVQGDLIVHIAGQDDQVVDGGGGTFTIHEDGTFSYDPGTVFDGLDAGESQTGILAYQIQLTTAGGSLVSDGCLMVTATMGSDGTLSYETCAYFPDFGMSWKADPEDPDTTPPNVFPDLAGYAAGLLENARAGGAGNSVSINNSGSITTQGNGAYGISARSRGANGAVGHGGTISHSAGAGGSGRRGGDIAVATRGRVTTYGDESSGIVAISRAGNGGNGGDGGTWRWGGPGGTGGNGGDVRVTGGGAIVTGMSQDADGTLVPNGAGKYASGILALSEGGDGGNGGEGHGAMGAGNGGSGGIGGTVAVIGDWDIITGGEKAHGIWAKSTGGYGGGGGSAGWMRGGGGTGGAALEGGAVTIESGGDIATWGADAYGLYAQSVGGFGGNGGGGFGLFCSVGAPGNNAGDGGVVTVTNEAPGHITTHNHRAHGIYAQSVGGGGGSGGGAGSIVAVGGKGAAGGNGGVVDVTNDGAITTFGDNARGLYAQSIGGGGGDGGNSGGFVGIGGEGSATSDGGNVTVANNGIIATEGFRSHAIFAQSIGGGGGDGGDSGGIFTIGGAGGGGGDAGTVTVTNTKEIATLGAEAAGIFAQSVGGGGGNGGGAVSVSDKVSIAVGGNGGAGGDGQAVRVAATADSEITTEGGGAYGILAQSVGGGGGNGGFSVAGNLGSGLSLTLAIGGSGGEGGGGGDVDLDNAGRVVTSGNDAHGIFAQSVGGGGGNGGMSIAANVGTGTSLNFSFGGSGGSGGAGGKVHAGSAETPLSGTIATSGNRSHGIFAQSVGGGGGNGGNAVTGQLLGGQTLSFSFGGDGGAGSCGDEVRVYNAGNIFTGYDFASRTVTGSESHGILAQSIGGGGGNGGMSLAAGVTAFGGLTFSMGGDGGSGNSGGQVTVDNEGGIETWGDYSHGVFAQSVGGGGGNGGTAGSAMINFASLIPLPPEIPVKLSANFSVAMGGEGGQGGAGGDVDVTNEGIIATRGDNSYGLLAQSVGGGGGAGGKSIAATGNISLPEEPSGADEANKQVEVKIDFALALGGAGGEGNNGGAVTVTNDGAIDTSGDGSHGIVAQSIGGGGGLGGDARSMTLSIDPSNSCLFPSPPEDPLGGFEKAVNISVGGHAGGGNDGGGVTVINRAAIVTRDADAYGIFAQSVGGGGGAGGGGYHGLDWTDLGVPEDFADLWEELSPIESDADYQIVVGGSGGSSGDGARVIVSNEGDILTLGDGSFGIVAQSIGAGGGTGGVGAVGEEGTVGVGGGGGAAGHGAAVDVATSGNIDTFGKAAYGILAQSIGGGGGLAGNVDRGIESFGNALDFNLDFGRDGGSAGHGGCVTIESTGTITTRGSGAYGIFAQSVGGGGGLAGDAVSGFAGSVGGDGSGGMVAVHHSGAIVTYGDASHGIFAQSAGGRSDAVIQQTTSLAGEFRQLAKDGLGNILFGTAPLDDQDDRGGDVGVTIEGNILAYGADSHGILAQSRGDDGHGDIAVTIDGGHVQGGTGAGAGVCFMDGAANTLENFGTITTLNGIDGSAIRATGGSEAIDNHGTVSGAVDLGTGSNTFTNHSGATFNTGTEVALGVGGILRNTGLVSPGGKGNLRHTALTGDFVQAAAGRMAVDLAPGNGDADHLAVSGATDFSGTIALNLVNAGEAAPGRRQFRILTSEGNLNAAGVDLVYKPSAVARHTVAEEAHAILIQTEIDYCPLTLGGNHRAIGDAVNKIQAMGGSDDFAVMAAELFRLSDTGALAAAYDQLAPLTYGDATRAALGAGQHYAATLFSHLNDMRGRLYAQEKNDPQPLLLAYHGADGTLGDLFGDRRRAPAQRKKSLWLQPLGQIGDQDAEDGFVGYDYRRAGIAGGFDYLLNENLVAGLGIGYTDTDLDFDRSRSTSRIDSYTGALYGTYFSDDFHIAGALAYSRNQYDNRRHIAVGALQRTADSDYDGDAYAASLSGGYTMRFETWMLQPFASLNYTYLDEEGFEESGAGSLNLGAGGRQTDSLTSQLGLRLAHAWNVGKGVFIPEMNAAWLHDFAIDDQRLTSSFAGTPGVAFTVEGREPDKDGLLLGAGFSYVGLNGWTGSIQYGGEFRGDYTAHGIYGQIRYAF